MSRFRSVIICCSAVFLGSGLVIGKVLAKEQVTAAPSTQQVQTTESTAGVNSTADVVDTVNINSADAATLRKVKWIGEKKSQAIVDYRNKNGKFNSLEDLLKVECRGMTKKWLDKVSKFLTV